MKAVICTSYGTPDVLQLNDVATPTPNAKEVRISIHAAVVGPADVAFRKGDPFIVKLIYGLSKPKLAIQGAEFAGVVESVGSAVTLFKPGDQVFGMSPDTFGAYAEYLCLSEDNPISIKPANLTLEESVVICDATTALTFLRDVAKLQPGQTILINGASGAVGAYAVQLAKYYGAEVTGVCSSANLNLVKSLGADHVIDYTSIDFTKTGETYNVIFDAVGKRSFAQCKNALTRDGVYLTTVPTLSVAVSMLVTALFGSKKAKFATAGLMQNKANLAFLKELTEAGVIQPVIDRYYRLEQIAQAHAYVETGRKKGSVVISVKQPD